MIEKYFKRFFKKANENVAVVSEKVSDLASGIEEEVIDIFSERGVGSTLKECLPRGFIPRTGYVTPTGIELSGPVYENQSC